jgi:lipoate-protein ligase A
VPHDADWTYSLVFPPRHEWYSLTARESYRLIHEWIQSAFASLGIDTELASVAHRSQPGACFSGYEQFDLLWEGQKIAGAAQRRRRDGLLIQGSVQPPPLSITRDDWQQAMCECPLFRQRHWEDFEFNAELKTHASGLALQKYSQSTYNQRR